MPSYPWMREYPEYLADHERGLCFRHPKWKHAYVNNPRAASMSCRGLGRSRANHMAGRVSQKIDLSQYFSFSVIRDPVARFISTFLWLAYSQEWTNTARRTTQYKGREKPFFKHQPMDATKMHLFLEEIERGFWDVHTQPQCWWLSDEKFNLLELDHFFLLDHTLSEQISRVLRERCGRKVRMGVQNSTPPDRTQEARRIFESDARLYDWVKKIYICDFDLYENVRSRQPTR